MFSVTIFAQETPSRTAASGIVVDAESGETLPFVQVYFLKSTTSKGMTASGVGTTTDLDGNFTISNTAGYTMLTFQMMGYKTKTITVSKGHSKANMKIKLDPDVYGLQDVIITPKNKKKDYRRRGNPAVELIKNVIANKNEHCVQSLDYYTAQSYTRMSFALDNININWEKPFWKSFTFLKKYIDTTGVYPNVTVSIRENLNDEYYQRRPYKEKKIIQKNRVFGVEDLVTYGSIHENIKELFKDVDINHNSLNLLYNRFVSPLSSSIAVSFYQYYIMDTIMVDGYQCIDLAFVPVNSESTPSIFLQKSTSTSRATTPLSIIMSSWRMVCGHPTERPLMPNSIFSTRKKVWWHDRPRYIPTGIWKHLFHLIYSRT